MRQQVKTFTRAQVHKGRQLIAILDKGAEGKPYIALGGVSKEFERLSADELKELKQENGAALLVVEVEKP